MAEKGVSRVNTAKKPSSIVSARLTIDEAEAIQDFCAQRHWSVKDLMRHAIGLVQEIEDTARHQIETVAEEKATQQAMHQVTAHVLKRLRQQARQEYYQELRTVIWQGAYATARKDLRQEVEESVRQAQFEAGYAQGHADAMQKFAVRYPCADCGQELIVHTATEQQVCREALESEAFHHTYHDQP